MKLIDQIEKAQDQALDTIAGTQKRVLEVNDKLAGSVKDRFGAVKLPFASVLPTPAEGVKLYFDFAGKVLATNRKFAEHAVAAWSVEKAPKAAKARPGRPRVAKVA